MGTVKTAISLDKELFIKVEKLSNKLHLSRSGFFSQAAEYIIKKNEKLELLQKINQAYSDLPEAVENTNLKKAKLKYSQIIKGTW
jgi:metal-responsive CopG/Arc/MetJ family transcriptional regulator